MSLTHLVELYSGYLIVTFLNILAAWVAVLHCAIKGPAQDKTPWILAILAVPLAGWICYWLYAAKEQGYSTTRQPVPPAPPKPQSHDIADAVQASMEEMTRKKRAGQRQQ